MSQRGFDYFMSLFIKAYVFKNNSRNMNKQYMPFKSLIKCIKTIDPELLELFENRICPFCMKEIRNARAFMIHVRIAERNHYIPYMRKIYTYCVEGEPALA